MRQPVKRLAKTIGQRPGNAGSTSPTCACAALATSKRSHLPSWEALDDAMETAAIEDDTVGNGIFDDPWAPPVQHAGNGVFEADYSEPGWLYREQLTRRAHAPDSGHLPVITMPAGGGPPKQVARAYRPWDQATPRPYAAGRSLVANRRPVAMGSLGDDASSDDASLAEWAIGGLVAGAGAYMLFAWLKGR